MFLLLWSFDARAGDGDGDWDDEEITSATTIHAFAEGLVTWTRTGTDPHFDGVARLRRAGIAVGRDFGPEVPISAEVELEVEDAIASSGSGGRVELEEAKLVWSAVGTSLNVRAGLLLVPISEVNLRHSPLDYRSADRPQLDQTLLPTTWRELGFGLSGARGPVRYELDVLTALDPTGFDDAGIVNGRTLGEASPADAVAFAGRVDVRPAKGLRLAASGYGSDAGGAGDWYDAEGERLRLTMPIFAAEVDGEWRFAGLEVRAEGVSWWMPQSDDLLEAYRADGSPYFPEGSEPVPTRMIGGYVEVGYDVLSLVDAKGSLVPFLRLEHLDSQASVPEGTTANPLRTMDVGTFGASWTPSGTVTLKGDVQLRDRRYGDDELAAELALGFVL
jgi:hypothetical protein